MDGKVPIPRITFVDSSRMYPLPSITDRTLETSLLNIPFLCRSISSDSIETDGCGRYGSSFSKGWIEMIVASKPKWVCSAFARFTVTRSPPPRRFKSAMRLFYLSFRMFCVNMIPSSVRFDRTCIEWAPEDFSSLLEIVQITFPCSYYFWSQSLLFVT